MNRDFDVELEIIDKNIEVECELPENTKQKEVVKHGFATVRGWITQKKKTLI